MSMLMLYRERYQRWQEIEAQAMTQQNEDLIEKLNWARYGQLIGALNERVEYFYTQLTTLSEKLHAVSLEVTKPRESGNAVMHSIANDLREMRDVVRVGINAHNELVARVRVLEGHTVPEPAEWGDARRKLNDVAYRTEVLERWLKDNRAYYDKAKDADLKLAERVETLENSTAWSELGWRITRIGAELDTRLRAVENHLAQTRSLDALADRAHGPLEGKVTPYPDEDDPLVTYDHRLDVEPMGRNFTHEEYREQVTALVKAARAHLEDESTASRVALGTALLAFGRSE